MPKRPHRVRIPKKTFNLSRGMSATPQSRRSSAQARRENFDPLITRLCQV